MIFLTFLEDIHVLESMRYVSLSLLHLQKMHGGDVKQCAFAFRQLSIFLLSKGFVNLSPSLDRHTTAPFAQFALLGDNMTSAKEIHE